MDDNTKCCLGILIVIVIIALFFFWPSATEAKETYMKCYVHDETSDGNDGYIEITCYENNSAKNESDIVLENATVLVNVTYANNTVVKYNLTTDEYGHAEITNLSKGNYTVSAYLVGSDTHNTSTYTQKVEIEEYVAPTKTTTETKTEYETDYDTEYETEYETYYDTGETYTYRYYWVYV